jgi:uncharacterized protein YraI
MAGMATRTVSAKHKNMAKRALFTLIIISVLLLSFSANVPARADTGSNWTGAYYNNQTLSGSPIFNRIDPALVFNWGPYGPGPGIGGEHWSARWTSIQFLNAGTYQFNVTVDDGVRIYIDGQIVIDQWHDQGPTAYSANVAVVTGTHAIQVDYYQNLGDASLSVSWNYVSSTLTAWAAQYYNNPYLQGYPVASRYENAINYDWGVGGSPDPSVPFNYFSARWTATLPFSAATYRFTITASNGVRLYIDNNMIVNQWQVGPTTAYVLDVPLSAGVHTLRLEYFEWTGDATVKLDYTVAVGPPPYQNQTWFGEYFNNPNLQGSPVFTRDDGASGIAFNWSFTTPTLNIGHDNYSVRWTRNMYFPGRPYTFYLTTDDGARLWIDTTLIIDSWQVQSARTISQVVNLTEGPHQLRLEYFQATGNALINLTWDPPNGQNPPQAPGGGTISGPIGSTSVNATVATDVLNVRNGPGTGYPVLRTISFGEVYNVVSRVPDNSWLLLNVNGITGWSSTAYLTLGVGALDQVPVSSSLPPSSLPSGVLIVTLTNIRVRSGPNPANPIVGNLSYGSTVNVIGRTGDNSWLQVTYSTDAGPYTGWVYSPYVRLISGSISNVPVSG